MTMGTDSNTPDPLVTPRDIERALGRRTLRNRTRWAIACPVIGVVLIFLTVIGMAVFNPRSFEFSPEAMAFTGAVGGIFGALAVLHVPFVLDRKPWIRSLKYLVAISASATLVSAALGFLPVFGAGIALSAAAIGVGVWMPSMAEGWTADRCVVCGYDLTGQPTNRCPECGVTEAEVAPVAARRATEGASFAGMMWQSIVLIVWILGTVMVYGMMASM